MITISHTHLPPLLSYNRLIKKMWTTGQITNIGPLVKKLEDRLQSYLNTNNIQITLNGTLALHIALKSLSLLKHERDEIITTPFTFPATTNAIVWEGFRPVFSDINAQTWNINPKDVEKKITKHTSAILAVHAYGNPCDVGQFKQIAKKHNIKLIFDAAHAFGVEYDQRPIVHFGDISILSFHAAKVFHTIEGGAIITKHKKLREQLKTWVNHGIDPDAKEVEVLTLGTNTKMDEFRAAMGLCNLKIIDKLILRRKKLYGLYARHLNDGNPKIQFQTVVASRYNYAYMPVLFENERMRDRVHDTLWKNRIYARKYFYPLTSEAKYLKKTLAQIKQETPIAFSISRRVLCLPLYPDLREQDVKRICRIVKNVITD